MNKNVNDIKKAVKDGYARVAQTGSSCCGSSYCGKGDATRTGALVGYSSDDMTAVPDGANLGLGCGNPVALAELKAGDIVLDLGSGAGFDAFLAAKRVGTTGKVIGVDMTPEMIERARTNAQKGNYTNVEFRLGEIEKLPVDSNTIDVIISNCVINLSPEKEKVFAEAFRVLKPGGRLMVSDLVLTKDLPARVKASAEAYVGCIAGAIMKDEYLGGITRAGFSDVTVVSESVYPVEVMEDVVEGKLHADSGAITALDLKAAEDAVASIKVRAVKQ